MNVRLRGRRLTQGWRRESAAASDAVVVVVKGLLQLLLLVVVTEIRDGGRGGSSTGGAGISEGGFGFSGVDVRLAERRGILRLLGNLARPVADVFQFFLKRRRGFLGEGAQTGAAVVAAGVGSAVNRSLARME